VPLAEYKAAAAWLQIRTTCCTLKASFIYGNSRCFCVQKSFLAEIRVATSENVGDLLSVCVMTTGAGVHYNRGVHAAVSTGALETQHCSHICYSRLAKALITALNIQLFFQVSNLSQLATEILSTVYCLRLKAHNVSITGTASSFRWNAKGEKLFFLVQENERNILRAHMTNTTSAHTVYLCVLCGSQ